MNLFGYEHSEKYKTKVAYFSMEFAIHQALKIYSGGLGFLSGSHMRSAHDLQQNIVGIGILWSYGYYDQSRNEDRSLKVEFRRKRYYFLEDLNTNVTVMINSRPVTVKAWLLPSEVFATAPVILLSTDIEENDFISKTITHKLYDANEETRIAQEIVLGIGGIKILEKLGKEADIYHMNEGHSLPLVFELYNKYKDMNEVKKRVVFTTHTPEAAGNEIHEIHLLDKMGFFNGVGLEKAREITGTHDNAFSLSVGALRCAKVSNAVSKIHGIVANKMWSPYENISKIISITNAQNKRYWADKGMLRAFEDNEEYELIARKKHLKRQLFNEVADQTGKMFDYDVLTIVWARRFAEYKRPGLVKQDLERLEKLILSEERPIQIIWAGKPYPLDSSSINIFNELIDLSSRYKRMAVLVKYELALSILLKKGADIWLNTPRITREASGTSGMSACMNGAIHFSIADGWHPEFAKEGINSFTIPPVDHLLPKEEQDKIDNANLMDILEEKIIPLYYDKPKEWVKIMKNSMSDIYEFDSGRMAYEYYTKMYDYTDESNDSL